MNERDQIGASGRADLFAFGGAFVIGCAFIGIFKAAEVRQIIITITVMAVIAGYAAVVALTPRMRLRLDQAGDNAYYLGLLFTLISMSLALYAVSVDVSSTADASAAPSRTAERIIGDFGVALGSTIAGIFARLLLQQMRIDPSDVETTTRLQLSQAAEQLRTELNDVTASMRSFHDGLRQSSEDLAHKLMLEFSKGTEELHRRVAVAGDHFATELEKAAATVPPRMADVQTQLQDTAAELNQTIAKLKSAGTPLLQLNTRLAKISDSLGTTSQALDSSTTRFSEALVKVNQTQKAIGELVLQVEGLVQKLPERDKDLVSSVERNLRALESSQSLLTDLYARQAASVKTLGDHSQQSLEAMTRAQTTATEVLSSMSARQAASVKTFEDHSKQSLDAVTRAQTASTEVLTALTTLTETIEQRLRAAAAPV